MDLGCPLLRGSSDHRLRRRAATVSLLLRSEIISLKKLYLSSQFLIYQTAYWVKSAADQGSAD